MQRQCKCIAKALQMHSKGKAKALQRQCKRNAKVMQIGLAHALNRYCLLGETAVSEQKLCAFFRRGKVGHRTNEKLPYSLVSRFVGSSYPPRSPGGSPHLPAAHQAGSCGFLININKEAPRAPPRGGTRQLREK